VYNERFEFDIKLNSLYRALLIDTQFTKLILSTKQLTSS
jgi:hypothetical protein